mgnify:FL=1
MTEFWGVPVHVKDICKLVVAGLLPVKDVKLLETFKFMAATAELLERGNYDMLLTNSTIRDWLGDTDLADRDEVTSTIEDMIHDNMIDSILEHYASWPDLNQTAPNLGVPFELCYLDVNGNGNNKLCLGVGVKNYKLGISDVLDTLFVPVLGDLWQPEWLTDESAIANDCD